MNDEFLRDGTQYSVPSTQSQISVSGHGYLLRCGVELSVLSGTRSGSWKLRAEY
jgi:hypothetical protein